MIVFVADVQLKEGKLDAYRPHYEARREALLGTLDGLVYDEMFVNPDNPDRLALISKFETAEAYAEYGQSPAMKAYFGSIMPLIEKFELADLYTVSETKSLIPA